MFKKPATAVALDTAIEKAFEDLQNYSADDEPYGDIVDQLSKLYKMKTETSPKRVSNDTLATIAANLLGIALILHYEKTQIVVGRALNFVQKLR